jgi:acetyl esterase/lipase
LWPPPPDELGSAVRERLRTRIRQAVFLSKDKEKDHSSTPSRPVKPLEGGHDLQLPETGRTLHLGSTASLPTIHSGATEQIVTCTTKSGETLTIDDQIHLYTPNYLLNHPLISPVVSYLGGLPPMLVIAGDAEVLRDEIIYM